MSDKITQAEDRAYTESLKVCFEHGPDYWRVRAQMAERRAVKMAAQLADMRQQLADMRQQLRDAKTVRKK